MTSEVWFAESTRVRTSQPPGLGSHPDSTFTRSVGSCEGVPRSRVVTVTTKRGAWDAGTQPWIRRQPEKSGVLCYFCGEFSAIVSLYDRPADNGRVEVYCTNSDCEAREITILVMKDGTLETFERSDVRMLRVIDEPSRRGQLRPDRRRPLPEDSVVDRLLQGHDEVVARRLSPGAVAGVREVGSGLSDES